MNDSKKPNEYDIDKVSPRPWEFERGPVTVWKDPYNQETNRIYHTVSEYERGGVAESSSNANAAHIVHCVNAHDDLVKENEMLGSIVDDFATLFESVAARLQDNTWSKGGIAVMLKSGHQRMVWKLKALASIKVKPK